MVLMSKIEKILEEYIVEKNNPLKDNPLAEIVRNDIPKILADYLDDDKYLVKGSVGQGQWAHIPWIAIFNKKITTNATRGYDIVLLFQADMSGFYLTLNQGWTYYKENYKPKSEAQKKIKKVATILQGEFQEIPSQFNSDTIDLKHDSDLPKGYELGNITSRYYSQNHLPTDIEFLNDISDLLQIYDQLYYLIGENRTFEDLNKELLAHNDRKFIETETEEEVYQANIEEILVKEDYLYEEEVASTKPKAIKTKEGEAKWPRDSEISATAIVKANFQCEVDPTHRTFTSNKTKRQFMEAHHLIPMQFQNIFNNSLDKVANIICLCPNCHRQIHYGTSDEKEDLIEKLYRKAERELIKVGINIDLNDLKNLYGVRRN